MPPPGAPEGENIFSNLPKWAWYVGGAGIVGVGYIFYRNRKQAKAAQQAATTPGTAASTYSAGAQAGAYGSPLPGAGVLDPILLQQPISVNLGGGGGCPCGTQPNTQNMSVMGGSQQPSTACAPCPTTKQIQIQNNKPVDWKLLQSQTPDVQSYLRALAAQTQKTGGWTVVPNSFPVPANAKMTGSGPGYVTYIPAPPPNSPPVTAAF